MTSFPPLRMAVLSGLIDLKADLASLDDPSCTYDEDTKTTIRALLAPVVVERIVEKEVQVQGKPGRGRPSKDIELSTEDKELLNTEIKALISAMNDMGTGEGLETSQRIQLTKTKTSLVDTLLKMRERNTTATRMEEFQETVIRILDDLVSEPDRDVFLRRLEPFR